MVPNCSRLWIPAFQTVPQVTELHIFILCHSREVCGGLDPVAGIQYPLF